MKKETTKYGVIAGISFVLLALIAVFAALNRSSDMIMPAVYILDGMTSWYVILLALVAECVIINLMINETFLKAASMSLLMNLVSTALGFITIFLTGLLTEVILLPFNTPTYHVLNWILTLLLVAIVNTLIEGLTLKIAFKQKFRKAFLPLCAANGIAVLVCFLCNLTWVSEMIV